MKIRQKFLARIAGATLASILNIGISYILLNQMKIQKKSKLLGIVGAFSASYMSYICYKVYSDSNIYLY